MLTTSIGAAATRYELNQRELTFEGNRLLSTESIVTTAALADIRRAWSTGDRVTAYLEVDGGVRAVSSTDLGDTAYPVHEGRSFQPGDDGVALAGAHVPVAERDGTEIFVVGDREYEVVGRLGRQPDSLVGYEVLIADSTLFSASRPQPLVLDGADMAQRYAKAFPGAEFSEVDASTNRRTSIDFVSPLVIGLSRGMALVGAMLTGLIAAALLRDRNRVAELVGRSRRRVLAASVLEVAVTLGVVGGLVGLTWQAAAPVPHPVRAVAVLVAPALAAVAALVAALRPEPRA